MKIVFFLLLISSSAMSQDSVLYNIFPLKDGKIYYEKIIQIDTTSKDQLYSRAKMWGLSYYNSQKDAIQVDDKENGIIAYKGYFSQLFEYPKTMGIKPYPDTWNYWETVKILIKDNKAKIVVTDFLIKNSVAPIEIESYEKDMKKQIKGVSQKYRNNVVASAMENFRQADFRIKAMVSQIQDYLSGSKTKDNNF